MKSIILDGKEFVKASEAAKEHGYTNDYIGQLCRGNKVDAQLVGRVWYVHVESLLKHRKGRYRSSQKKTKEEVEKVLAIEHSAHSGSPRYYNRLVSNTKIEYIPDDREDLIPKPKKLVVDSDEEIQKTEENHHGLEISVTEEAEAEYYVDTVYEEKPKSGVLQIVEDETEPPLVAEEADITHKDNITRRGHTTRQLVRTLRHSDDSKHPTKTENNLVSKPIKKSAVVRHRVETVNISLHSVVAPLSVSLLAGLAIAMLMIGLSWQFQSDSSGYSESYRVNMSSLMLK